MLLNGQTTNILQLFSLNNSALTYNCFNEVTSALTYNRCE